VGLTGSGVFWSRLRLGFSLGAVLAGAVLVGASAQAKQASTTSAATTAATVSAGITIQNLDSTAGTAEVQYYSTVNGVTTLAYDQTNVSLPANGNVNIYPIPAPSGFSGSAVVLSANNINAVVNLLQSNPTAGEAYDGVPASGTGAAATTEFGPTFMQNNGGYNSSLFVQNASSSSNTVSVTFTQNGVASAPLQTTLQPYGSITYDASNDQLGSGKWLGSVTINGTQPVAAVINETNGTQLFSYTASAANVNGTTLYAPLLMTNNGGYSTGFSVQNAGSVQTTITLTPSGNMSLPQATAVLAPGQSIAWYPIPGTTIGGAKFVGSGKVTSNPPVSLLGSVNQLNTGTGQASSYSAFTGGTQTVNFPLAMFNNGGYYTSENIQNVGTSAATVDILVNGAVVSGQTQVIQPGGSYNWYSSTSNVILQGAKTGSVQAHARETGSQIVGVSNEITVPQQSGDTFFAYEGFPG
jgi:hypothetical protein